MKFKINYSFFIFSCTSQLTTLNQKKPYNAKGFAYIYNEDDLKKRLSKEKMNNELCKYLIKI